MTEDQAAGLILDGHAFCSHDSEYPGWRVKAEPEDDYVFDFRLATNEESDMFDKAARLLGRKWRGNNPNIGDSRVQDVA